MDACSHLVMLVEKGRRVRVPDTVPHANAINARLGRGNWTKPPGAVVVELANKRGTRVTLGFVDKQADAFQRLTAARKLMAAALAERPDTLAITFAGIAADRVPGWADALVAAAGAAAFDLAEFKQHKGPKPRRLQTLKLLGLPKRLDLAYTQAATLGNNLARWLSALPGNALAPTQYRKLIDRLAKQESWKVEVMDQRELARRGCGAFLAVVQGSAEADAAVVRLQYRPGRRKQKGTVALVGKGICYDTGGVNLKPSRYMFGMHEDMQGSAVALGTLLALSELEVPFAVDCWLALAQNHVGPKAYKPNDVITAADGTTIEIVHTDAEGRMVLADTLTLVAKTKPELAIDYATLTGSCVNALGSRYNGVFTNRDDMNVKLVEAGRASGERVWPFPQDADYDEMLDSKVADIKQCSLENEADHILGARFLGRFIGKDIPWVHVDLSTMNSKGGLAHVPTDTICSGVRFTLQFLGVGPR